MPTQLASMARHAPTALAACLLSTQRLPDILGCMCKAVHELMACSNVTHGVGPSPTLRPFACVARLAAAAAALAGSLLQPLLPRWRAVLPHAVSASADASVAG